MKQRMHKLMHTPRWVAALVLAGMSVSMVSAMAKQIETYTVTDGMESKTVSSLSDDLEYVCEKAGFDTEDFEIIDVQAKSETMTEVQVEKKFPITIRTAEGAVQMETVSATVSEQLIRAGVSFDSDDKLEPAADTEITAPAEIKLIRVETRTEEKTETVPFTMETRNNAQMAYGTSRIAQEGVNGQNLRTYEVVYEDGAEVSRKMTADKVVTPAVPQITEIGTSGAVTTRSGEVLRYSKVVEVEATSYSGEEASGQVTAMGTRCRVGAIAVDPRVIPLGSRLYIEAADGESWVYGFATAEDTGGAIKGNRVDLFHNTTAESNRFGRRAAKVYILS